MKQLSPNARIAFVLIIIFALALSGCKTPIAPPALPDVTASAKPTFVVEASPAPTGVYAELSAMLDSCEPAFSLTLRGDDMENIDEFIDWLMRRDEVRAASYNYTTYIGRIEIEFTITYAMGYRLIYAYRGGDRAMLTGDERAALDEAQRVIASVIEPGMSDYEKEKAIHDYIVTTCDYSGADNSAAYNPYGVLIDKRAVCDGYSSTFKLFMDMLNIECAIVGGYADGEAHSWNLIRIEGEWYWLDVTWDDPVYADNQIVDDVIRYDWFNVTDDAINKTHVLDEAASVSCTATKHNYFYYNNLVANDKAELRAVFIDGETQNKAYLSVYYTGATLSVDEVCALFPSSVNRYSFGRDMRIITVLYK